MYKQLNGYLKNVTNFKPVINDNKFDEIFEENIIKMKNVPNSNNVMNHNNVTNPENVTSTIRNERKGSVKEERGERLIQTRSGRLIKKPSHLKDYTL